MGCHIVFLFEKQLQTFVVRCFVQVKLAYAVWWEKGNVEIWRTTETGEVKSIDSSLEQQVIVIEQRKKKKSKYAKGIGPYFLINLK